MHRAEIGTASTSVVPTMTRAPSAFSTIFPATGLRRLVWGDSTRIQPPDALRQAPVGGAPRSWEPNTRLVLSRDITADWRYDPDLKTEIEVRFIAAGKGGTRVELEHRRLDRYGARRDEMRRIFDTEGDWGRLLQAFAQVAAA